MDALFPETAIDDVETGPIAPVKPVTVTVDPMGNPTEAVNLKVIVFLAFCNNEDCLTRASVNKAAADAADKTPVVVVEVVAL